MDKDVQKIIELQAKEHKIVTDNLNEYVTQHDLRISELESNEIKIGQKILDNLTQIVIQKLDELKIKIPFPTETNTTSDDKSIKHLFS